jgi:hypothetical protein
VLAGNWQQSGKLWQDGDTNYDGTITIGDLGVLAGNWQKGVPTPLSQPVGGVSAVPEPSSLALIGVAGAALLRRRRRQTN